MDTNAANAADAGANDSPSPLTEERIREELKNVVDPEIGLDVINLGLIYDVKVEADGKVAIAMTLTSPGCPVAGMFIANVKNDVEAIPGVSDCAVDLTIDPPWDPRT